MFMKRLAEPGMRCMSPQAPRRNGASLKPAHGQDEPVG
jgi:hypothetical protein